MFIGVPVFSTQYCKKITTPSVKEDRDGDKKRTKGVWRKRGSARNETTRYSLQNSEI